MGFDGITDGKFKINNKDFYNSLCDELNLQGEQREIINSIWNNIEKAVKEATDKDFNNVNQNEELDLNQMKCKDGQSLWQRILRMVENTLGDRSYLELKPEPGITEEYNEYGQLIKYSEKDSYTNDRPLYYEYDQEGRIIKTYRKTPEGKPYHVESTEYNEKDRITREGYSSDGKGKDDYYSTYEYNEDDNITKISHYNKYLRKPHQIRTYEYDGNGNIKKETIDYGKNKFKAADGKPEIVNIYQHDESDGNLE